MSIRRIHPSFCGMLGAVVLTTSFAAPLICARNAALLAETREHNAALPGGTGSPAADGAQQADGRRERSEVPTTCVVSEQCKMWDRAGQFSAGLRLHEMLQAAVLGPPAVQTAVPALHHSTPDPAPRPVEPRRALAGLPHGPPCAI